MATGTSLMLIAIGAILAFAVNLTTSGVDIHTIGVILMVVGAIGLVFSLILGALGGFLPARHAAKKEILTALRDV